MIQLNENLKVAIIVLLLASYVIYEQKPDLMFNEDGSFKEYSGTYTLARTIDMCTHLTANPTDEADPAFVSLVAD